MKFFINKRTKKPQSFKQKAAHKDSHNSYNSHDSDSSHDSDHKGGWTFIETLISISIVLLLTGTVSFMSFEFVKRAKVAAAKSQISSLILALQSYQLDTGTFPSEEQGLASLWEKPSLDPLPSAWNGPYIDQIVPNDPWGNEYKYLVPGQNGFPFEIVSYGSDRKPDGTGSERDIVSWNLQ